MLASANGRDGLLRAPLVWGGFWGRWKLFVQVCEYEICKASHGNYAGSEGCTVERFWFSYGYGASLLGDIALSADEH